MNQEAEQDIGPIPTVSIERPSRSVDLATVLGLFFAFAFIVGAILIGQSDANFINVPSLMIVLFGTTAATAISFSGTELRRSGRILGNSMFYSVQSPKKLASSLVDLAVIAKKKGI